MPVTRPPQRQSSRAIEVSAWRPPPIPPWRAAPGATVEAGGPTIAEGIAVKNPGVLTLPIIERLVDDVVLVDEGLPWKPLS